MFGIPSPKELSVGLPPFLAGLDTIKKPSISTTTRLHLIIESISSLSSLPPSHPYTLLSISPTNHPVFTAACSLQSGAIDIITLNDADDDDDDGSGALPFRLNRADIELGTRNNVAFEVVYGRAFRGVGEGGALARGTSRLQTLISTVRTFNNLSKGLRPKPKLFLSCGGRGDEVEVGVMRSGFDLGNFAEEVLGFRRGEEVKMFVEGVARGVLEGVEGRKMGKSKGGGTNRGVVVEEVIEAEKTKSGGVEDLEDLEDLDTNTKLKMEDGFMKL
ncbi:hypothetical protein ScalyP_jg1322 [Parmales sp. scaly parma]|nr:hypothetical protein ScalyP_jg1322 [Parmales sp. scaly parma]